MARKRKSSKQNPHLFPIVVSLVVFLALFLTLYTLMDKRTDVRSNASESRGVGQSVREEVSQAVRITSPSVNQTVANPVIVTADTPQGMAVERVQFFVDNQTEPVNEVVAAPYDTSVTLSPGRHRVSAVVYDTSGNVKRSQEVTFQVQ